MSTKKDKCKCFIPDKMTLLLCLKSLFSVIRLSDYDINRVCTPVAFHLTKYLVRHFWHFWHFWHSWHFWHFDILTFWQSTLSDRRSIWSLARTCPHRTGDNHSDFRQVCCWARRLCSWEGRLRSTPASCWGCWTPRWWRRGRRSRGPSGSRASRRRRPSRGSHTCGCRPGGQFNPNFSVSYWITSKCLLFKNINSCVYGLSLMLESYKWDGLDGIGWFWLDGMEIWRHLFYEHRVVRC